MMRRCGARSPTTVGVGWSYGVARDASRAARWDRCALICPRRRSIVAACDEPGCAGEIIIFKRYLLHVAGHNLALLMRQRIGACTPREAVAGGYGGIFVLLTPTGDPYRWHGGGSQSGQTAFAASIPHLGDDSRTKPLNQRAVKPASLGAGLFACRQGQHFRQLALEVDAQFIAIGHEADLVDEPTNYLAGFLPRFLGIERFSQVLYLLPVDFGEVGVQMGGGGSVASSCSIARLSPSRRSNSACRVSDRMPALTAATSDSSSLFILDSCFLRLCRRESSAAKRPFRLS